MSPLQALEIQKLERKKGANIKKQCCFKKKKEHHSGFEFSYLEIRISKS